MVLATGFMTGVRFPSGAADFLLETEDWLWDLRASSTTGAKNFPWQSSSQSMKVNIRFHLVVRLQIREAL
jgi:hypothetical protein